MEVKKINFIYYVQKNLIESVKLPFMSITLGLIVGGIIIALSGGDPFAAIKGLIVGGFGSMHAITVTLTRATPIIFAGLSAALAWGSGYSSMGASGQMILGAFTAAITAVSISGPSIVIIIVSLSAGMLAGIIYSLIAAYISAKFEVYLLIVTLMMNYIADNIASYLTTYDFRDPLAVDRLAVQTQKIIDGTLPRIFPRYTLHYGFIIAIACTLLVLFMMKRTSFGYEAKMSGLNPRFADYGGIDSLKTMYLVLMISGALAGLGGACESLGTRFRYVDGMITSGGYAWSGIIASLMASNHPVGVFVSSVFLAGLTTGGGSIELRHGIPSEISDIIEGVLTMFVTAKLVVDFRFGRLRAQKEDGADVV